MYSIEERPCVHSFLSWDLQFQNPYGSFFAGDDNLVLRDTGISVFRYIDRINFYVLKPLPVDFQITPRSRVGTETADEVMYLFGCFLVKLDLAVFFEDLRSGT
jgi:hypothetical protein